MQNEQHAKEKIVKCKRFLWQYWGLVCFGVLLLVRFITCVEYTYPKNPMSCFFYHGGETVLSLMFLFCLCLMPVIQNKRVLVLSVEKRFAIVALNSGAIMLWIVQLGSELVTVRGMEWKFGLFSVVSVALSITGWYLWLLWTKD